MVFIRRAIFRKYCRKTSCEGFHASIARKDQTNSDLSLYHEESTNVMLFDAVESFLRVFGQYFLEGLLRSFDVLAAKSCLAICVL